MKIVQLYNYQRSLFGGEPTVVRDLTELLNQKGHTVVQYTYPSFQPVSSVTKRSAAFINGCFNITTYSEMAALIREHRPDVVHAHNVYPTISPSPFVACRKSGVPVVMTVHSQALTCPNWYHFYEGKVCQECIGGHEYRCILKNCRNNLLESVAYSLRSSFARFFRLFLNNVTVLIALTESAKASLVKAGFREEQIVVIPNCTAIADTAVDRVEGGYIAFAGRLSPEKGIDTLISAAQTTGCPVKLAGDGPLFAATSAKAPANVELLGMLKQAALVDFYRNARLLVVPSICLEQFGIVAVEAMALGLPVVASRIGGLPEVVVDGVTGLLFEPGNADDLADKISHLWSDPELCCRMGEAGRQRVIDCYNVELYYEQTIAAYQKAMQLSSSQT